MQVRLQLETLLAEKSRLAQENANYARENRFLREVVEYHQLTMQDVVYLDENIEEVTEVGLDPLRGTQKERLPFENYHVIKKIQLKCHHLLMQSTCVLPWMVYILKCQISSPLQR